MTVPARLRLTGIQKSFGATRALRSVSLEIAPGEVHALIGENGAGKSTLMKVLSGAHEPDAGTMELGGQPYRPDNPHDARLKGVAMIYQELNLALHLSAQENILLGAESARFGFVNARAARERARAALAQLGHGSLDLARRAGDFSIAEQQIIEIARALLLQPQVLIMDEPTSSLTQADTEILFATIGRLRAQGVSIIYISHFLEECGRVADRYTVLKDGETVGSGAMAGASLDHIVALMTGREVKDLYPRTSHQPGAVVLEVRSAVLSRFVGRGASPASPEAKTEPIGRKARPTCSLQVRAGEIFGLAGLIGAGRTELLRAVFGLDDLAAGEVCVVGAPAGRSVPRERWRQGVGFLSENRKEEGLMLNRSVADNLTLTKLRSFGRFGHVSGARQRSAARRWIDELRVKCLDAAQPVGELSGGNQQKVALARLLEHPARIFLLDEPTRGIDVGSKAQIYQLIGGLAAAGKAVVVVSSYLPELLGLCDTIGVMCRGELAAVRPRADWTEADILRAATGSA
ncbi:MAG TPA: sugar ABC transporter ATP-binding protein [Lacunisphaera sp.]|jgi:ribose transport system ATP-binding protein|nr:sugar ABC transporter ATP-binding protein [Lacunisphaera sp.]